MARRYRGYRDPSAYAGPMRYPAGGPALVFRFRKAVTTRIGWWLFKRVSRVPLDPPYEIGAVLHDRRVGQAVAERLA